MKTEYHGGSVAGGTFPAEIWHDYMSKVKGKFCGDFKPPKEPFHASPFFGKYSRSGGRGTGEGDDQQSGGTQFYAPTTPTAPAPTTPDTQKKPDTGNGNGNGNDKGKFNPDLYESPPQGAPTTGGGNGQDGGATAPDG
jgi:penicillin-binding protein 1A